MYHSEEAAPIAPTGGDAEDAFFVNVIWTASLCQRDDAGLKLPAFFLPLVMLEKVSGSWSPVTSNRSWSPITSSGLQLGHCCACPTSSAPEIPANATLSRSEFLWEEGLWKLMTFYNTWVSLEIYRLSHASASVENLSSFSQWISKERQTAP